MKNILGVFILVFAVAVFYSCGKAGEEKNDTSIKEGQKSKGKSRAILETEKEEKIQKAISEKKELRKKKRTEAKFRRKARIAREAKAFFDLGVKYSNPKSKNKNFKEAMKQFKKAAELGYGEAQHSLGLMYLKGKGAPQDNIKAYKWASLAAAQNKKHKQLADLIKTKLTKKEIAKVKKMISAFSAK
ncbi:MAG: tetratricopeptide repeat protein [Elusimicrobiota bacterium]|nr:tetratricopeptide repeat protein [Elusimicrobiota bacterium]